MAMAIAMMAIVLTPLSSLNIYECDDEEINLRRYHPVSSGFEIISSRRPQKSRPGAGHKNGRRDDDDDDDDGSLFKIELTD